MIIFFGPPGSGKSVQGELLVRRNNWHWLSTGQLFRHSKDPEVLKRLATGELIDDELTNKVLSAALMEADPEKRVVLDGYPRNRQQAAWLDQHLPRHGREIKTVIVFDVPKAELIKRLAGRGRDEDNPAVIERRLEIYQQNTQPIIDFYREQNIPVNIINGAGPVEAVHNRIQKVVEACLLV